MVAPFQNGYYTRMDKRLLEILCCPVSKTPLRRLHKNELKYINQAIAADRVDRVDGNAVEGPLDDGLITTDSKVVYRIADGIPVLLPEEGIGTTQFSQFPSA